jgi:VWFA-related protein
MHNHRRKPSPTAVPAVIVLLVTFAIVSIGWGLLRPLHAQATMITMFVSVLDNEGNPVPGLQADEFIVRENGVRREVLRVTQPAKDPIFIALLVDNTAASSPYVQDIRRGVQAFVDAAHAGNFIALVTFADRPVVFVDYTRGLAQLTAAVNRVFPISGSGSYLLDALVDLGRDMAKRKAERGVIVALSADGPEFSNFTYQQALEALADGGASLNAVVINPRAGGGSSEETKSRLIVLDRGPTESGGVHMDVMSSLALPDRMGLLATQLMNQYRLDYARPESLIPPDRFTVSVTRPGLEAHGTRPRPQSR